MEQMLSGGTTLLFVSHSIEQVKQLCKRAIWIDRGRIRATARRRRSATLCGGHAAGRVKASPEGEAVREAD